MIGRIFLSGLALGLSAATASAAVEPDNVAAAVAEAAGLCRVMGGEPNTEAMLSVSDLNGDGAEDWIVDFAKLDCAGAPNPFCGTGGCTLQVYLWSSDDTWTRVLDETARRHALKESGGDKVFEIVTGGNACDRPNFEDCTLRFRFEGTELVPME